MSKHGKVVLAQAWSSLCLPCQEEFPDLMRLYREFAPHGLELVLISADLQAWREQARTFLAGQGVDFPAFSTTGSLEAFIEAFDPAWSGSLPATLVLGQNGQRRGFWPGAATYEEFRKVVEPLLGEKGPEKCPAPLAAARSA